MADRDRDLHLDDDPHSLLFGSDDDLDADGAGPGAAAAAGAAAGAAQYRSRSEQRRAEREVERHRRRRHGRRGVVVIAVILLLAVLAAGWFVARPLYNDRYHPKDYSGSGTGSVLVKIDDGDDANAIGGKLLKAGVVASSRAFVNAANANSQAGQIQPGTYQLHLHMQASQAVALMLTASDRVTVKVTVPEGWTTLQIETALATQLQVAPSAIQAAVANVSALGLPTSYTVNGQTPTSIEGFLYPATYTFDPGTSPTDALSEMVSTFVDRDRANGYAQAAPSLHITAYQELIIASIAQAEAKFPADMPKVARVLLNRLAQGRNLQVDATSAYAARLQGLDLSKVIYSQLDSPYNTYTHAGLPPTPIGNPGGEALTAAAKPAAGDWLYYVNDDAAGHLGFYDNQTAFTQAQETCYKNNWGCAAP